ncbi:MAG: hypothetical protein GY938_31015 [Ketobacter sp.]|nr:hypothetical protein [Ketobacter sp.]
MADEKISDRTPASAAALDDRIPVAAGDPSFVDEYITNQQVLTLFLGEANTWTENQSFTKSIFQTEQAAAQADVAGDGQWWVKNDTPNIPMFTDDAGTDFELATETYVDVLTGFYNGAAIDSPVVAVASNGAVITLSLEKSGTGDIDFKFSDGIHSHDCTPAATIALTAGTDTVPKINYIYILQSNKTLTVSAVGWPSAEHAPIATVLCQSAATLQTDGSMKVHAWTDHVTGSDGQGHLTHLNGLMRSKPATWLSGVAQTFTPTVGGGTDTIIDVSLTAGVVFQLHRHTFPAFDTAVSDVIYIVNEPTTPYTKMAGLVRASLPEDSTGSTLSNRRYPLFLYGIVSEDEADCKLCVNLPSDSYGTDALAIQDADNYVDTAIPSDYIGTAFPIAIITLRDRNSSSSLEVLDIKDVTTTGVGGGGTGGVATSEFLDGVFAVNNTADPTKQLQISVSGIATGTMRTWTAPDADVDLTGLVHLTGAETLVSKTLTAPNITAPVVETTVDSTWTGTEVLNTDNGDIQEITIITANVSTLTDELDDGECVVLHVNDGTGPYTLADPAGIVWTSDSGSSPGLQATVATIITYWKVGSVLFGHAANGT